MACQERAGFLFSHDCGRPPVHQCRQCHKGICEKHAHMYEGNVLCTSCAKQAVGARRGRVRDERDHPQDDEWTTHPYFYGAYHYHGYGDYHDMGWGDPDDFSPADGGGFRRPREHGWEHDPGGS